MSTITQKILFFPDAQKTVRDVQNRIREIDMALYPSIKASQLGEVRTFTYSTLAGCCHFLDSVANGRYSSEVESFAKEVVAPVVEECFETIEKYSYALANDSLKISLVDSLKKMQLYPKRNEFTEDAALEVIQKLTNVVFSGKFGFYKLKELDSKYYGGVLQIEEDIFSEIVKIMEDAGYKETGDINGSSFDVSGHVTTIFSKELCENYEHIISVHNQFVANTPTASIKPTAISYGYPQSGILAKAVVIKVDSPEIEAYRQACGLGKLIPPAHISVFTKIIQAVQELKADNTTFFQFIDAETPFLSKLNKIIKT